MTEELEILFSDAAATLEDLVSSIAPIQPLMWDDARQELETALQAIQKAADVLLYLAMPPAD